MNNIENDYLTIKKLYKEIFLKAQKAIEEQLTPLKINTKCTDCKSNCTIKDTNSLPLVKLEKDCVYRDWQKEALRKLNTEISKDIYEKIQEVDKFRSTFGCARCASCCRLASSEFSPEELREKAKNGDVFASQFLSVFKPYKTYEEARAIYPEYFELLQKTYGKNESIYFYYCPKLTDENLCSDYENRPQICRDFPNNPLALLPKKCGYNDWKEQVEVVSMMLHALIQIVEFHKEKLEVALAD